MTHGWPIDAVLDGLELASAPLSCRDSAGPLPIRFDWGSLHLNIRVDPEYIGIEPTCGAAPSWLPLSDAVRPGLNRLDIALAGNCDFGGPLLYLGLLRHHQRAQPGVGCQHAVVPDQM
jgi:hypothetical protein